MTPSQRRKLDMKDPVDALREKLEKWKSGLRAKVEHPVARHKRQYGHVNIRYRGLAKNAAQVMTLLMLSNLWMVRARSHG